LSEAKIQNAIALYQSGNSFVTVGKELNFNPETIRGPSYGAHMNIEAQLSEVVN
jgi:hypothetical protein